VYRRGRGVSEQNITFIFRVEAKTEESGDNLSFFLGLFFYLEDGGDN
jgi:hypothetical protein